VYAPVASDPAEKKALLLALSVHNVVATPPAESVLQFAVAVFQVPDGLVPPAPVVAPLMSQ